MSLREQHKADKRDRILSAARQRFIEDGFDSTTIRAIAKDAGVAVGTVLLYANSKHELLQDVWRQEIVPVVDRAIADAKGQPTRPSLMALFSPLLQAYSKRPDLARVVVKELPWLQGAAWQSHLIDLQQYLQAIAEALQGAVPEPHATAELLFTVYYGACVRLLAQASPPDADAAIQWLERQIDIILRGSRR